MMTCSVTTSDDPSPLELIFAAKFRRALVQDQYLKDASACQGTFGLKSSTDPQSITIACKPGEITLQSGIAPECQIVIKVDLNKPEQKPEIKGLLRHPLFAIKVGKLLEFPEASWSDALKEFWQNHQNYQGMPHGLTVKCIDEDRQLSVGQTESACYLEANSKHLAEVFSGGTPLLQLLATGKIRGRYTFEQAVVLSDITLHMMLGEL